MKIWYLLWRGIYILAASLAAWGLSRVLGPWQGAVAWTIIIGAACAFSGWALHQSKMGEITWRNRLAGFLLPWGYRLGGGKLPRMLLVCWIVWAAIGAAALYLLAFNTQHPILLVLLFLVWIFYGAMIVRQLGFIFYQFRNSPRARHSMVMLTLVMVGLIAGSAIAWAMQLPLFALLIAGGPVAVIGGGYGLMLLAFMSFGRHGRFN